jgi:hypothetical protein
MGNLGYSNCAVSIATLRVSRYWQDMLPSFALVITTCASTKALVTCRWRESLLSICHFFSCVYVTSSCWIPSSDPSCSTLFFVTFLVQAKELHKRGSSLATRGLPVTSTPCLSNCHSYYRFASSRGALVSPMSRLPSRIEPATFRLVAQCLNQLRHRVPLLKPK